MTPSNRRKAFSQSRQGARFVQSSHRVPSAQKPKRIRQLETAQALKESEERFSRLASAASEGTIFCQAGKLIDANDQFAQMTGYRLDELIGAQMTRFVAPESRNWVMGKIHNHDEGPYDFLALRKDGSTFPVEMRARSIRYQGRAARLCAIRDITARKQAEEDWRRSEERYRTVADFTYDWEYWLGPNGNLLYVSPACERITGYRPDEFSNNPNLLTAITHPDDQAFIAKHQQQAMINREPYATLDFRIITRAGDIRWISHRCQPVFGTDGTWLGRRSSNTDITERKQSDDALRISEQKYRGIVRSSKDGILLVDQKGIIVEWNSSQEQITGLQARAVLGKQIQEVWRRVILPNHLAPETIDQFDGILNHLIQTGDVSRIQQHETHPMQRPDGSIRMIELTIFPIASDAGYMIGSICRDVTDTNQAKEALAAEKERLDITLHSIGDGVITTDTEQRIILFNPAAEQFTGWKHQEAEGRPLSDIFHLINKRTRQVVKNPAQIAMERGQTLGMPSDTVLVAKDGTERIISSSIAPIHGRTGEITGVALVFRDITRLRLAEEALIESREYAHNLIESSHDMIIAADNDRKIIEFNRAAQQAFGYSAEEILGQDASILYADPKVGIDINQTTSQTGGFTQEVLNRRKNGEIFPSRLSASLLKNAHGEIVGMMGVSRDITQLKQTEEQNIRAERLAALGHMAAALAHEINNPLQAIQSTLDLVLDFPVSEQEREENLKIIRQEIERLNQVTGRVLQFARPAQAPRRLVSIANLIEQTLALAGKYLQHSRITVVTELEDIPPVPASPEQLSQTFLNIILNAIEATGQGGHLEITSHADSPDAIITFTNDGPVIPFDVIQHIFEPFFTTKPEGSGLGLSVSHAILQRHGGAISVENLGSERGVRFTIRLPMTQVNPPKEPNA